MRCCATRARFMSVMAVVVLVSFSPNGEYLAYSSPDGVLKLWETTTGKLAQEYTPSSHLSATCSCLQWGPNRRPRVSFTETFSLTVCHSQSVTVTCCSLPYIPYRTPLSPVMPVVQHVQSSPNWESDCFFYRLKKIKRFLEKLLMLEKQI